MSKKPLIFKKAVKIRFSDIDRYQHVNTIYYPDYVYTSRFEFIEEKFGIAPNFFEKEGVGFYTVRFESRFEKSIPASASYVQVISQVNEVDRALVKIGFKITDPSEQLVYSSGGFEFYVIDLATQKPFKAVPESFEKILFEIKTEES